MNQSKTQINFIQKTNSSNNILQNDAETQSKSDEDFLGYSSQYNTSNNSNEKNKTEEISNEFNDFRKRKFSDEPPQNLKKNFILKTESFRKNSDINISKYLREFFDGENRKKKLKTDTENIYNYLDGSDKFLRRHHKQTIDLENSMNFIKKEDLFNKAHNEDINNNINNEQSDNINNRPNIAVNYFYNYLNNNNANNNLNNDWNNNEQNKNESLKPNNNINNSINNNINKKINNKIFQNNKMKNFPLQQIGIDMSMLNRGEIYQNSSNIKNMQQNIENINNKTLIDYKNFQQNLCNLNNIINQNENLIKRKLTYGIDDNVPRYFNNIFNTKIQNINKCCPQNDFNKMLFSYNENQTEKLENKYIRNIKFQNEKKTLDKRKGDWLCPECNNLNFAFRIKCNRCYIQKPPNAIIINH